LPAGRRAAGELPIPSRSVTSVAASGIASPGAVAVGAGASVAAVPAEACGTACGPSVLGQRAARFASTPARAPAVASGQGTTITSIAPLGLGGTWLARAVARPRIHGTAAVATRRRARFAR
jgi:hypothetical protein